MDTDVPIKVLFRACPADILVLTGDQGARVLSVDTLELQQIRRQVDCVIRLEKDGHTYLRHVEIQARTDPDIAERCFRYNTQLLLQYGLPVLTTVVYLFPVPEPADLTYRVVIGDTEINRWTFHTVHLWELDARAALESRAPGLVALVPLMQGGRPLAAIAEAAHILEQAPIATDAMSVLLLLAGRHYTVAELSHVVGRDKMIESSIWQEAKAEGWTQGRTEGLNQGRTEAERELCLALVDEFHPHLVGKAAPIIEACTDPETLKRWALAAPRSTDTALARLLGLRPTPPRRGPRR
jgi:predicted transposase YdaD